MRSWAVSWVVVIIRSECVTLLPPDEFPWGPRAGFHASSAQQWQQRGSQQQRRGLLPFLLLRIWTNSTTSHPEPPTSSTLPGPYTPSCPVHWPAYPLLPGARPPQPNALPTAPPNHSSSTAPAEDPPLQPLSSTQSASDQRRDGEIAPALPDQLQPCLARPYHPGFHHPAFLPAIPPLLPPPAAQPAPAYPPAVPAALPSAAETEPACAPAAPPAPPPTQLPRPAATIPPRPQPIPVSEPKHHRLLSALPPSSVSLYPPQSHKDLWNHTIRKPVTTGNLSLQLIFS